MEPTQLAMSMANQQNELETTNHQQREWAFGLLKTKGPQSYSVNIILYLGISYIYGGEYSEPSFKV